MGGGNLRDRGLLAPRLAAEEPKGNFEVHDLSLWILEQGSQQANMRNELSHGTAGHRAHRGTAQRNVPAGSVGPINLIRFYGPPATNLDIDLRTKAGSFLAHWPASEGLPNRLRWSGTPSVDLVEKVDDESSLSYVDARALVSQSCAKGTRCSSAAVRGPSDSWPTTSN